MTQTIRLYPVIKFSEIAFGVCGAGASSSAAAPEPIETCDRDLPVASVNLQQPSSSSAAPAPIETCDCDLPVTSVNLQQPSSSSAAPEPIETCDRDLPVASVNFNNRHLHQQCQRLLKPATVTCLPSLLTCNNRHRKCQQNK
ncbi:unnamed protein product [Parnassius apollo]|uniref:(apollo) hypothetical protein n=1 Tax=Parnassius apollo TaxID=110799 RepID=A0A8S3WF66_PARAO|nr:unnamed protein product [Parnassius apollo]